MSTPTSTPTSQAPSTTVGAHEAARPLSVARMNVMRGGYLFMAVGLTIVKWPLITDAADRPLFESVTIAMLLAMSLGAWLGLRYPVKMLPVLLFESGWKLLWLGAVALPLALSGDLDSKATELAVNCSLVVVVLAVIPWRHVWRTYVSAAGDRWR